MFYLAFADNLITEPGSFFQKRLSSEDDTDRQIDPDSMFGCFSYNLHEEVCFLEYLSIMKWTPDVDWMSRCLP